MRSEPSVDTKDFGIADVFGDAFAAFRQCFGTHVAFTALFMFALVLSSCFFGCGVSALFAGFGAVTAGHGPHGGEFVTELGMLLGYIVFLGVFMLAMTAHQAFTLDVTVRSIRGEPTDLSSGLRASGAHLLSHFGFAVFRVVSDTIVGCVLFGAIVAIGGFDMLRHWDVTRAPSPEAIVERFGALALFFALAYFAWIAWVIALRGFLGLAPAAIQMEGCATVDGVSRGVRLLEGRRMQFIGMRIVWGIAWFVGVCLLYVPMVLIMMVAGDGGDARALLALLILPYALFFYFAMFVTYGFDSALEAAFYARLVPKPEPTPSVADVFA